MIKAKRGNITSILLPIMFMIFISIIVSIIFVYFQISISLYDVKLNTFYIVQSSISKEDYDDIVYGDYTLSIKILKDNINTLYEKIYSERPASYTTKAINLYSEPNKNSKTVAFAAQEYIASATDDKNWVYLIGKDGSKGWLYCDDRSIYDENGDMVEYVDGNGFIDAVTGESLGDIFKEIFVYG